MPFDATVSRLLPRANSMFDEGADNRLGCHPVQIIADRTNELSPATGDDGDPELASSELIQELSRSLIDNEDLQGRMSGTCHVVTSTGGASGELLENPANAS